MVAEEHPLLRNLAGPECFHLYEELGLSKKPSWKGKEHRSGLLQVSWSTCWVRAAGSGRVLGQWEECWTWIQALSPPSLARELGQTEPQFPH